MASTLGFLREYLRARPAAVEARDDVYRRGGEPVAATVYRPVGRPGPLPAWVLLHGLTCQGRRHRSLDRFARAVAHSGALVFVPEIPEWSRLEVAPAVTLPTIRAAVAAVRGRRDVVPERVGTIGFSFGATQALVAAAHDGGSDLRGIAAWGGYADLHNLFHFGFCGEHELDGARYRVDPDPYGRWIMAARYLTRVPGLSDHGDVAAALRHLALEAGRRGAYAWEPVYDPMKARLRADLPPSRRALFDLFAPLSGFPVADQAEGAALARALADAALTEDPLLDPGPHLPGIRVRTLLAHGRDDRLVPFTESIRLQRALPANACQGCTITALFAHSGGTQRQHGPVGVARETVRFLRLLGGILDLV